MGKRAASLLVIVGAGGHGAVVADAAIATGRWERIVATDRNPTTWGTFLLDDVPVLPMDEALALGEAEFHVAIGEGRARESETLALGGRPVVSVAHPLAAVSPFARQAQGCFVAALAVLAPKSVLQAGVIVNHGAVVDHDVEVGAFSHVAPRTTLGGKARAGAGVLLGAGSVVLPGITVADRTVIGAGAVVDRDVTQSGVYVGVPARRRA